MTSFQYQISKRSQINYQEQYILPHLLKDSTPFGHQEYLRIPFGLKNAPSTFQRLLNCVLKEHINKICVVYMDDIFLFSITLEEHIQSLTKIFNAHKNTQPTYNSISVTFALRKHLLCQVLTSEGVKPNFRKINKIQELNQKPQDK